MFLFTEIHFNRPLLYPIGHDSQQLFKFNDIDLELDQPYIKSNPLADVRAAD